jgi:hypothetical protein
VATEYASSKTTSPFSLRTAFPFHQVLYPVLRSKPIPPVTSTVVRKIGEIPFVPATSEQYNEGNIWTCFLPVQRATLFTPDILDEPTPVPFQQSTSHFYQGVVLVMLESHLVPQEKLNIYHEVHDLILSALGYLRK